MAALLGSSLGACAHSATPLADAAPAAAKARARLAAEGSDQAQAKKRFEQGQAQLRRGTFADALRTFEEVRTHFPYSPYAALAELAEADTYFREGRFLEAADAYRSFMRFHPAHAEGRYALGQVTESQYAQVPHAYWFMPPIAEKDPTVLHQAMEAADDFLQRFKDGRAAERARTIRQNCQQMLADHELYVARFYYRRKLWAGARTRALNLLATYPKLQTEPETLWLAGSAALFEGDLPAGHGLLEKLVQDYPHAAEAKRARVLQARFPRQEPES